MVSGASGMREGWFLVEEARPVHVPLKVWLEAQRPQVIHPVISRRKDHQVLPAVHRGIAGEVANIVPPGGEHELDELVER